MFTEVKGERSKIPQREYDAIISYFILLLLRLDSSARAWSGLVVGHRVRVGEVLAADREAVHVRHDGLHLGVLYTESGQTLQGSFSAVSEPKFAQINSK